jgi:hypothetical protein
VRDLEERDVAVPERDGSPRGVEQADAQARPQ